jgi:hypothetical protein
MAAAQRRKEQSSRNRVGETGRGETDVACSESFFKGTTEPAVECCVAGLVECPDEERQRFRPFHETTSSMTFRLTSSLNLHSCRFAVVNPR